MTERIGTCWQNAKPIKFKLADDKIIQSICWQSYENSIIQAILNNMNLSQLSDKLQSVEKVIQFCQEKNLLAKLKVAGHVSILAIKKNEKKPMPGDVEIPNAERRLHCAKGRFSKLAIAQILKLKYLWSHEMATVKNIRRECGINSTHTLIDWSSCVLSAYFDSFRYRPVNAHESSALSR